jgi:putative SOS response-associated peptidase YedK
MFQRYSLVAPERLVSRFLARAAQPLRPQSRYNVGRGDVMPIVVNRGGAYHLEQASWGLVPAWAQDTSRPFITAHAATVAERPSSKQAFRSQRCLVPATSFFGIDTAADRRGAYLFRLVDESITSLAGIYDAWRGPDGTELNSFAIITCAANELVSPISDVMPVILRRGSSPSLLRRCVPTASAPPSYRRVTTAPT